MTAKNILRHSVEMAHMLTNAYVGDLTDADLLVRSVPGSNHVAWQMGHLIVSTQQMLAALGHTPPALPPGFETAYTAETAASDDPKKFATKQQYVDLAGQIKEASLKAIDDTPEDTLDRPGPEPMRDFAPTVASVLMMLGAHWTMHVGQFVPIRRKLGKAPLF
jgi:hypothetical protein